MTTTTHIDEVIIEAKTIYKCDICSVKYRSLTDAEECENKGLTEPEFYIGQEVALFEKGWDEYDRVSRIVVGILHEGHAPIYQLNELVYRGNEEYIGAGFNDTRDYHNPAEEWDMQAF